MPTKYPQELKTRALRILTDRLENNPDQGIYTACREIGERLGIGPETLRKWHKQAEIDAGNAPGTTTDMAAENRRLRKENAELKRTNEILRTVSAFSQPSSTDRTDDDPLYIGTRIVSESRTSTPR